MTLKVNHLTKSIKSKVIVKDVSFQVMSGEIVGLLGPNGAGKTTTMKMIVGLTSFQSGEVTIQGKPITSYFEDSIKNIGCVIETPSFYPSLTAKENLIYFAQLSKIPINDVEEVASKLGLSHVLQKKVKHYSLGMKQRLGIAQALMHKPSILILDEPFNGLDPEGIKSVRVLLRELSTHTGVAILISSHLISEIELFCDRVIIMKNGEVKDDFKLSGIEDAPVKTSFYVDSIDNVLRLLPPEIHSILIDPHDQKLTVLMKRDSVPNLLAYLLKNQIKVFEVKRERNSLEERFMAVVGGNIIE